MKRVFALMIAALMLALCACGQESTPAQGEQSKTDTKQTQTAQITADGYYVEEEIRDDGMISTTYRVGAPDGVIAKITIEYADGSYREERYDSEGNLEYSIYERPDAFVWEQYFYPSGNVSKDIMKEFDGSYTEVHFLDNGSTDEATGTVISGAITYQKYVTADGQVTEFTYDIDMEEDGTYWFNNVNDDGTVERSHFDTSNTIIEAITDNKKTGDHVEEEYVDGLLYKRTQTNKNNDNRIEMTYYESGKEKTYDSYDAQRKERIYMEYYERGSVKHFLQETNDDYKHEEKYNEAGYTTYYYDSKQDLEFFANDEGELLKCVSKGKVYEGDAIPSKERDTFNEVRQVPDENATATEETTPAEEVTLFDGIQVEEGYHEEYYPSGKLKHITNKTDDIFLELYYDEDGYSTYFRQIGEGFDLEITCDETGKVNKVIFNGEEQTDVEGFVKNLNFRSW